MSERTWDNFLSFLYELPSTLRPGRQRIRVVRDSLLSLVENTILPKLDADDNERLFPLGFSPAESDLKIAAGVGLERGLISAEQYEQALREDKVASPFGFLQTMSGKTFGETVAPLIAKYWLVDRDNQFVKMRNTELYDFAVKLDQDKLPVRIEMKASSEGSPNFQQIRHPKMTNQAASEYEYDVLLGLGLSNEGLEWWVFPAEAVIELISSGIFTPQHGGQKSQSGTYWVRLDARNRVRLARFQTNSESLPSFIQNLLK